MTGRVDDPLVAFAVKWEPFGGASAADVFVEFGLGMDEYRRKLFHKLSRPDRAGVPPQVRQRLISYSLIPVQQSPRRGE